MAGDRTDTETANPERLEYLERAFQGLTDKEKIELIEEHDPDLIREIVKRQGEISASEFAHVD